VGGPGDYLPTEWLAANSCAEHSSWVYNKVGVVTPLSAWARYNCGTLASLELAYIYINHALIRELDLYDSGVQSGMSGGLVWIFNILDLTASHIQTKPLKLNLCSNTL
jgi:hypothetical protein